MKIAPTFEIVGLLASLDEWKNRGKRNPNLVKTTREHKNGNSKTITIDTFGGSFPIRLETLDAAKDLQDGKYYKVIGTVVGVRGTPYLRAETIEEVAEADSMVLPAWQAAGLVRGVTKREHESGDATYTVRFAPYLTTMNFYGVDEEIGGSLSNGDPIKCSGSLSTSERGIAFDLVDVEPLGSTAKPKAKTGSKQTAGAA